VLEFTSHVRRMGTGYPSGNVMMMWGDDMRYASLEAAQRQFLLGKSSHQFARRKRRCGPGVLSPSLPLSVSPSLRLSLSPSLKPCALKHTYAPALSLTRPHARALARTHARTHVNTHTHTRTWTRQERS
jgi:hypothetical protein